MRWSVIRIIFRHNTLFTKMTTPSALEMSTASETSETKLNDLTVPSAVRGMKILDKAKFNKEINVHCYFFEKSKAAKALKLLKPYMIRVPGLQPIKEGHEPCCRVAYLDPVKVPNGFEDLNPKSQKALVSMGFSKETSVRKVVLGYENFKADEILRAVIPAEYETVSGYSVIGHIIHLNLKPELEEYKSIIGQVLLDKTPNIETVLTKTNSIESTFRNFTMEVIAGSHAFETSTRENRFVFNLDFSKVYWNPRLSQEHLKVTNLLSKNDILFDVFCGIGPFVIPAAKKGVRCFANDLNPSAVQWLEANIRANKVDQTKVCVWSLDGKLFILDVVKKSLGEFQPGKYSIWVVMNLPALAPTFFAAFKGLFTPEEYSEVADIPCPTARVYCFVKCKTSENQSEAKKLIEAEVGMSLDDEIVRIEFVRNVAPNKDMMMVQVKLTRRILVDQKRTLLEAFTSDSKKLCSTPSP